MPGSKLLSMLPVNHALSSRQNQIQNPPKPATRSVQEVGNPSDICVGLHCRVQEPPAAAYSKVSSNGDGEVMIVLCVFKAPVLKIAVK